MKRKVRATAWKLRTPSNVFLDDLVTFAEILSEVGSVEIETDELAEVTVEQLREMRGVAPSWITLTALTDANNEPLEQLMLVDISSDRFAAAIKDDRAILFGALEKVKSRMEGRHRRVIVRVGEAYTLGAVVGLVLAISLSIVFTTRPLGSLLPIAAAVLAIILALFGLSKTGSGPRLVELHLYPSFEHRTFWQRNGEGLLVNLLVGLVFYLLGIATTLVLGALKVGS